MSLTPRPLGCVLAGGQSSRMGADKATLVLDGEPLVSRAVRLLVASGCDARIAGARCAGLEQYAPVLADTHPGCGPLAGIERGLSAASEAQIADQPAGAAVLFLPVDLPLLPSFLLRLLLGRAAQTGALATVPLVAGQPQPLCAVYRVELLAGMREALGAGDYKVMRVLRQLTGQPGQQDFFCVEAVLAAAGHGWGHDDQLPAYRWFTNLNTPADLHALRA